MRKALFPGLRLGYAVVRELLAAFATARYLLDRQPPTLYQVVAAEFMGQGHFSAHVRRMRLMYREQRGALTATLLPHAGDELEIEVPDQGMHLVAYLTRGKSDVGIEAAAARAGIIARAISRFYRSAPPRAGGDQAINCAGTKLPGEPLTRRLPLEIASSTGLPWVC